METYAAKNFAKIIQDQSENIRIRAHDELKDVEKRLLAEWSATKVREEGPQKKRVTYAFDSDELEQEVDLGSMPTRKIRKMIQKHFLTGFSWSLNAPKIMTNDLDLLTFK